MMLKGKNALVTGGSRGIGSAICESYLKNGASLCYLSRSRNSRHTELKQLADENGSVFEWLACDMADKQAIEQALEKSQALMPTIDILVNNAGITQDGLLMRMSDQQWQQVVDINLNSVFYTCRALFRRFVKQKNGSIINISSVVGIGGNGGQCNYAASKAAIIGFSKSLAKEIAGKQVRVNCIAPGFIATDMTEALPEQGRSQLLENIPLKRIGAAEDVAAAALFLAADISAYITGQTLVVDGGMSM